MSNPFKIDSPTCISFSGGRTSAYMLYRVLEAHQMSLPPEAVVCFANTGKEDEATLRFVQDCSEQWNVPITWLEWRDNDLGYEVVNFETASRNGEPFREMCIKRKALPNGFIASGSETCRGWSSASSCRCRRKQPAANSCRTDLPDTL